MKKFLIGTASFLMISATAALAQDGGSTQRGLDLAKDPYPGMGAMRPDVGTVIWPDGDIAGVGELNDPGNGGTYPSAGPQAYVPGWKSIK